MRNEVPNISDFKAVIEKKQIKFENFIEWETLVIMFRAFKSISSNLVEFRVFGVFKSNLANFQDLLDLLVGNLRNSKKKFDKINCSKLNWSASAKKQKKKGSDSVRKTWNQHPSKSKFTNLSMYCVELAHGDSKHPN